MKRASTIAFLVESYTPKDKKRATEIQECLADNCKNKCFDRLIIYSDGAQKSHSPDKRISHIVGEGRLTFSKYLAIARDPDCVYILANSDITFTEGCEYFRYIPDFELWALTRWEKSGVLWPGGRESQDIWALRGGNRATELVDSCRIPLGVPGCENAFAGRMHEAGFKVKNYCYDIRCLHVHEETSRGYGEKDRIPRPYYLPDPERLPILTRFRKRMHGLMA
jgi:hypothetical protein